MPHTSDDPYGLSSGVPSATAPGSPAPTGPREIWWAPYDPTRVPDGIPGSGFKPGLLSPYCTAGSFKCPQEPRWQCGYGMNYTTGSPAGQRDGSVSESSVRLVVWDHRRSAGCSDSRVASPPRPPWVPFVDGSHYPSRHAGRLTGLFHDGHADPLRPGLLRVRNFREPGSGPAVAGYEGE